MIEHPARAGIKALFADILTELSFLHGAAKGSWFGLPAITINGRILAALWLNGDAIFKLPGEAHARALALPGAALFQPLADRSPMREWVQVPPAHHEAWRELALAALEYVRETASKPARRSRRVRRNPG